MNITLGEVVGPDNVAIRLTCLIQCRKITVNIRRHLRERSQYAEYIRTCLKRSGSGDGLISA